MRIDLGMRGLLTLIGDKPRLLVECFRQFNIFHSTCTRRPLITSDYKQKARGERIKYFRVMFGTVDPDKEVLKSALDRAHDIRKFEIELYWKRSIYFWGFEIALLAIAGVLLSIDGDETPLLPIWPPLFAIALMGLFISFAWFYLSKGSKAWQNNWERNVDFLHTELEGDLYQMVLGDYKEFYSVSKINSDVIGAWIVFWFVSLVYLLIVIGYEALPETVKCPLSKIVNYPCWIAIIFCVISLLCFVVAFISWCRWQPNFQFIDGQETGCKKNEINPEINKRKYNLKL